jgi:hypothetical protein
MRRQKTSFLLFWLWIGLSAVMIPDARSAWVANGVPLSPNASNYKPVIISDGATGTIVAWYGGPGTDIFASRVLSDGTTAPGWPAAAPLLVCGATGLQEQPVLVSDQAGGALIFWQDARNGSDYDIYGQHINAAGLIVTSGPSNWIADGIPISSATGNQVSPMAVSDGAGGAIIVWQDGRNGAGNYDVYAARVDGFGQPQWVPAEVPVCRATNNQINPTIIADGSGGAYIAWQDYRKGTEYDIYAQHLTANGTVYPDPHWATNGLAVCQATNSQFYPVLSGDGGGGLFVAWQDFRSGTDNHIFAQHLGANGVVAGGWPQDGTPVCQAQFSQYYPQVTSDGGSGLFVTWQDYRDGTTNHVYAQHLTAGNTPWVADGIQVCAAANGQFSPQIAADGAGGAFIAWYDSRNGATNDIYAQQVSGSGALNPNFDRNGLGICIAPNTQQFPALAPSGPGTTVVTWQDLRAGGLTTAAIFAQQAGAAAAAGVEAPRLAAVQLSPARPNPFERDSKIRLTLAAPTFVRAEVLDVTGRHVATLALGTLDAGVHELSWDGSNARGERAAAGVYLVRVQWPGSRTTQRIVRLR